MVKFNFFWGLIGFLGILGYILKNAVYYVFFIFFLFFLEPFSKSGKNAGKGGKKCKKYTNNPYFEYNVSIWFGSVILMISGVILMATKTMTDLLAVLMLLGIMAFITNFFSYVGMDEKTKDERLRKIGTFATTYSWYITMVFVSFLVITMYWAQNIHNPLELMGVTMFVMVFTMLIANTILSRKGDID